MNHLSLQALIRGLRQREFSSKELVTYSLNRAQQYSHLNAFIDINEEEAIKQAEIADSLLKRKEGSALTGIPMAHKDIFCTKSMRTTCASRMLSNFYSPYDATIVQRFAENGCITLGKTNMDEFAMGSSNENSYFNAVKNPWNETCVPGGSSGGSAAAVSSGIVPFATGSDTGGSIRQPAAFCGISGLKPTYGRVSRFGMVAFASSLEQAGPMARSVQDLAYTLPIMAGFDERDATSVREPIVDYVGTLEKPLNKVRIGLPRGFFQQEVEDDIQKAILDAVKIYLAKGIEVIEIDLRLQPYWVPCYYVIACAEASSNLSRYDGVRYGHRTPEANNVVELITRSRDEGFGEEVKRRILTGTHVLSAGYFEDYYLQAQKVRRMIQVELLNMLAKVDFILGPTTPTCAFEIGEPNSELTKRYLADVFTVAANLAGLPALSIPAGLNQKGLPIGMQLIGNHFSEAALLHLGHTYQKETDWHLRIPNHGAQS